MATFGTADKPALLVGIVVLLAVYAAVVGVVGARNRPLGIAGIAAFAALGAAAAASSYRASLASMAPSLLGAVVAVPVLLWLLHALPGGRPSPGYGPGGGDALEDHAADRRRFLQISGGVAAAALVSIIGGQLLSRRLLPVDARKDLALPEPVRQLDLPVPATAHPDVPGLMPYITPNDDFYRIDTALTVPRVDPATHRLAVTGLVDRELDIAFDALLERDMIEIPITLSCVSNEVGGDLMDTAVWQGVRLREVLDEAGVDDAATQVVGRSVDGYTCGFPVEAAYDREALIAVGMNGEPLPLEHGFPVRLVVPGLYGYVSATKWLEEIELTTFEAFDQYWVPRGWDDMAPVKTASQINVPEPLAQVEPGPQAIAGVAWAPPHGIDKVEVRIDDGPWQEANLGDEVNELTWRQWHLRWEATPGQHRLTVRATDGRGELQPEERTAPKPNGATGWHNVLVRVGEA